MSEHLLQFPIAGEEARPYLEALERNHVPHSVVAEYDETTGAAVGIQVGVDAVGLDGFAQWVVVPFREDKFHGDGFVRGSDRLVAFEWSSLEWDALALGLAECRRGHRKAVITSEGCFQILKFQTRY